MFEWDDGNLNHVLHDYPERNNTVEEVESVFLDPNMYIKQDRIDKFGEFQYHGIGIGNEKQIKFVVFVIRNEKIRPISFRVASKKEKNRYHENIK